MGAPVSAQNVAAQNAQARALVLAASTPMLQQIYSQTFDPAVQSIINIPPQNVGLIKGFLVEITVEAENTAMSDDATLTPQGPANILQNILFTDLQNYQRINTPGWHLFNVNTAKQGNPFCSSTDTDSPVGYGNNSDAISAPSTIGHGDTESLRMFYWIPLAYGHNDLTGAIYAGVVNATMNLQLTFATSGQFFKASGDAVSAVYSGAAGTVNSYTVTVYQSYLDQLPVANGGIILPQMDINTIYEFKNSTFTGLSANQDFYVGYSNFRHFLSTLAIYDNAGTFDTASNINYFSFRTANYTDTRKADPYVWKTMERQKIKTDFPDGMYYFDTRDKPIYTTQTGNTNLVVNPSAVTTGATLLVGWEMLANVLNLQNAGSLASVG
jgi:hypothetical protein